MHMAIPPKYIVLLLIASVAAFNFKKSRYFQDAGYQISTKKDLEFCALFSSISISLSFRVRSNDEIPLLEITNPL